MRAAAGRAAAGRAAAGRAAAGRAATGRADLVRAWAGNGEAGLAGMARVLGYHRRQPERPVPAGIGAAVGEGTGPALATAPTPAPEAFAPIPFWQPVAVVYRDEQPAQERGEGQVLTAEYLRLPAGVEQPQPAPIVPWPRLWRRLDDTLRTPCPRREVDTAVMVRRWARGETVRRLPRRSGLVHARLALIVDRRPRLIPFWDDQVRLVAELARRLGAGSLRLVAAPETGNVPPTLDAGELLLAVSDLGLYAGPEGQQPWLRLGRALRRAGAAPQALVPYPRRRWRGAVAATWSAIDWSAPSGTGRPAAAGEDELREQLLRLLAPAVRIEPGLLREVRRLLPAADIGSEADAWADPRADGASPVALILEPAAARQWCEELAAGDEGLRQRAAETILAWHRALPPEMRAWDVVNLLASGLTPQQLGEEAVQEALELWRRAAATVDRAGEVPLGDDTDA